MNPTDINDPTHFSPPAPPAGWHLWFWVKCLGSNLMDCCEIWFTHPPFPRGRIVIMSSPPTVFIYKQHLLHVWGMGSLRCLVSSRLLQFFFVFGCEFLLIWVEGLGTEIVVCCTDCKLPRQMEPQVADSNYQQQRRKSGEIKWIMKSP